MDTLSSLYYSNPRYYQNSDKGTKHTYIKDFYTKVFTPLKNSPLNLVEIGISSGGSLALWRDWFISANITGIDNYAQENLEGKSFINTLSNVNIILEDGYNNDTINKFEDNSIDYLIDDGPHTIESQLECLQKYYPKVKPGGKIIIEDVQGNPSLDRLVSFGTNSSQYTFEVFDFKKGIDNIIVVFTKL